MPAKKPKPPVPYEDDEQIAYLEYCDIMGYKYHHSPNETWTESIKQKTRNKKLGTQSGFPDLVVLVPTGRHHPALQMIGIEMKRVKGSKTSEDQILWGAYFEKAGIPWRVCKGAAEAILFTKEVAQTLVRQREAELKIDRTTAADRDTIKSTSDSQTKEG